MSARDTLAKTRRLTFYLLQDGIEGFENALDDEKNAVEVVRSKASGIDGRFYYVKPVEMR